MIPGRCTCQRRFYADCIQCGDSVDAAARSNEETVTVIDRGRSRAASAERWALTQPRPSHAALSHVQNVSKHVILSVQIFSTG